MCRGVGPENVVLANRTPAKAEALAEALGCRAATNDVVAQDCDVIFLGVKPQMMADMLAGIAPILAKRSGRFVLVTMAAGLSMARVREMAGRCISNHPYHAQHPGFAGGRYDPVLR